MFFQLLYIHLFRPFLKYNPNNSPLPAHVSPRKHCTTAAAQISKLLRLYKRSHGLRQIPNIVVYIAHSACTIHLLNLPEKNAKRDIIHGVKHLEEIAEGWLCARRTLGILSVLVKRWKVELPEEATAVLVRTDEKFGPWSDVSTPKPPPHSPQATSEQPPQQISPALQPYSISLANTATQFFDRSGNPRTSMSAGIPHTRTSEARSLPPNDENPLAYPRQQPDYTSPPSTARRSIDAGTSTTGNSPSQLFGGVEQLIREGQDWWLRDQNQLAVGFDNWNYGVDDIASWFASGGGVGSPGQTQNPGAAPAAFANTSPVLEGGAVGGMAMGNGNGNGGLGSHGMGGVYDGGFNGYPNESEWYS
jgi:hypothetical protein